MAGNEDEELGLLRLGQPAVRDAALHRDAVGLEAAEKSSLAALEKLVKGRGEIAQPPVVVQIAVAKIIDSEVHWGSIPGPFRRT